MQLSSPVAAPHYADALNQVRAICLWSLVIIHCLSFSAEATGVAIHEIPGLIGIYFISGFNALFLLLTGVVFRLSVSPDLRDHRLKKEAFWKILNPLLALLIIETVKDLLLYDNLATILQWNFLKTLSLSWVVIYTLGRQHVRWNLPLGVLLAVLFPWLREWIMQFEKVQTITQPTSGWTEAHSVLWLFLLGWSAITFIQIRSLNWPRPLKKTSLFCLGLTISGLGLGLLSWTPDSEGYARAMNWWVWGMVGDNQFHTLMPFLVWAPSVLLGFSITDLVLRFRPELEKVSPLYWLVLCLFTVAVLFKFLIWNNLEWLMSLLTSTTWNEYSNSQTNIFFEIFKLALFGALFFLCIEINQRWSLPRWRKAARRWSQASFWIYILATSWSFISAVHLARRGYSLGTVLGGSLVSTLILGTAIVSFIDLLSRKRIYLTLRKNTPSY